MNENWKKEIAQLLKQLGLIDGQFTGRIVLDFRDGEIVNIEKAQKFR